MLTSCTTFRTLAPLQPQDGETTFPNSIFCSALLGGGAEDGTSLFSVASILFRRSVAQKGAHSRGWTRERARGRSWAENDKIREIEKKMWTRWGEDALKRFQRDGKMFEMLSQVVEKKNGALRVRKGNDELCLLVSACATHLQFIACPFLVRFRVSDPSSADSRYK